MKSMASGRTQKTHVSAVHQITAALMDKSYHWAHHINIHNFKKDIVYYSYVLSYQRQTQGNQSCIMISYC